MTYDLQPKPRLLPALMETPHQEENLALVHRGLQTFPDWVDVRVLAFDERGDLWGAGFGGIVRWMITPNHITYKLWHSEHGLAGNDVISLLVINSQEVICGHDSGWISLYKQGTWCTLDTGSHFPVHNLTMSSEGQIFACTDQGIFEIGNDIAELVLTIPESVLSMTSAFGSLWIGTGNGVWRFEQGAWQKIEVDVSLANTCQLKLGPNRLWVAGFNGLGYFTNPFTFTKTPVLEPVSALITHGDRALVSTEAGVFMDNRVQITSAHLSLLAAFDQTLIMGTSEHIMAYPPNAKERHLFRRSTGAPVDTIHIFESGSRFWMQCYDGSIWQRTLLDWTNISRISPARVTAIASFKHLTLLGFESENGLGIFDGELFRISHDIGYVTGLTTTSSGLFAATLDGLYQSRDGVTWSKWMALKAFGVIEGIFKGPDDAIYVYATNGLFYLKDQTLEKLASFDVPVTVVTQDSNTGDLWWSDGVEVFHLTRGSSPEVIRLPNQNTITALGFQQGQLVVGTTHGLWIGSNGSYKYMDANSGLPSSSIVELQSNESHLMVLTAAGLTIVDPNPL